MSNVAPVSADDADRLVSAMAGRAINDIYGYRARPTGAKMVEIDALAGPGIAAPVDLTVARGEILGLFGLVGAGRSELFRLIYGATTPDGGTVRIDGQAVAPGNPRARCQRRLRTARRRALSR